MEELDSFDTFIDNLRIELGELLIIKKFNFTLDILDSYKKDKCLKSYDEKFKILTFNYDNNEPFYIQIKFKNDINPFNKLFQIGVGDPPINIRVIIINSILNNSCIIDGQNLYFKNSSFSLFPITEYNLKNDVDSIVEDIYVYNQFKINFNNFTQHILPYSICESSSNTTFYINPTINLVFSYIKINDLAPDINYIIFNYKLCGIINQLNYQ